ncbi:CAP domain-containing protein [Qipengyuania sp. S6317L1]|uniref:CAP domain-containing protein n=1 Tax=Qipengyuania sp. S6317L1 TaxID=2926410 RepID=UPI001FF6EFF3|nr:CAP domain-containing protein [Qipengyuania sp. S6317L1]MCK0098425.1 CAP domain-containing protein [Qipengyuania sp. S6317L1]
MSTATDLEQYNLELINDARLDPMGNAARYISSYDPLTARFSNIQSALNFFGVDADDLLSGFEALVPTAPVAWNDNLALAARTHNGEMIAADEQSHRLPGEAGLGDRITAAGYTGWFTVAENVFAFTQDIMYGHAGFMVDWGFEPNGIQNPAGHRIAIMNPNYSEIGIGATPENNPGTDVGPLVVTQNFGNRGGIFLLGVAYTDSDQDAFYTPGEGLGTLNVTVGGQQFTSGSAGGYNVELSQTSNVQVTFGGAATNQSASLTLTNVTQNVKADVVNGDTLRLSGSGHVEGFANIVVISLAGLTVSSGEGAQTFLGHAGNDTFDGGSGIDTAAFGGASSSFTVTQTALGVFEVSGANGTDTLTNIEYLEFDDTVIRLLRGTGVSVNFDTVDPSVYQSAMDNILDFDGNALGGNGAWLRIGSTDVNGDGDVDQILVNDAIGRFATVGTADDGLVYFNDNTWAGETRVAGIYIDPLVEAGIVEQFGPNDSQQRFQNDLQIENINRVLGSNDYDGDGIWEVYFALTDGTAYLRALMHADGNIRYANYQSEQGVRDYLTAHGFGEETFGTWFGGGADGQSADNPPVALSGADTSAMLHFLDPMQHEFFG